MKGAIADAASCFFTLFFKLFKARFEEDSLPGGLSLDFDLRPDCLKCDPCLEIID